MGIEKFVTERTDRIPFYQSLNTLSEADLLFIPGSNDAQYTASKIYPYILAKQPLLAIFHSDSSAGKIIRECKAGTVVTFDMEMPNALAEIKNTLKQAILGEKNNLNFSGEAFEPYTAKKRTAEQTAFFDDIIDHK
jgi:hypothetical protein